ncbi:MULTISPECIES: hypothetical protein [unclassified Streptomyces]|uniref:hypothetical protein n=1 Tax=unclassified Streptomyces TaxID=2593676 RepID=UPI0033FEC4E3
MSLTMIGAAFAVCAVAGFLTGSLRAHHVDGVLALCNIAYWIDSTLDGDQLWAAVDATCVAWFGWRWWNGGGGDDTKRRFREWRRRFTAVRRTAPQAV